MMEAIIIYEHFNGAALVYIYIHLTFHGRLKFVSVKPLEEDAALEKATDFIAEFLLIGFGTCIIVSEVGGYRCLANVNMHVDIYVLVPCLQYFRSEKKNAEKALLAAQKEAEEEKVRLIR
jgi:hypothetical protein